MESKVYFDAVKKYQSSAKHSKRWLWLIFGSYFLSCTLSVLLIVLLSLFSSKHGSNQEIQEEINRELISALTINALVLVALGFIVIVWYKNTVNYSQYFIARHAKSLRKSQELKLLYPEILKISEQLDISADILVLQTPQNVVFPSVEQYLGAAVLVLPLGFIHLLLKQPEEARFILAHELSHIRHGDLHLFRQSEAYTRVLLPLILTIGILNIMTVFYMISYNPKSVVDDMQFIAQILSPVFYIACVIIAWDSVRKTRYRSEQLADWGAALITNTNAGISVFERIKKEHGLLDNRHPSPDDRAQHLYEIMENRK